MAFTFPKKERLKSKKIIEQVFLDGLAIRAFPLKLIYLNTPLDQPVQTQVALVAPKKNFRSAVKRNRIKRLLRENYRLNKHLIFNNTERQYALVILYIGKEMPSFRDIDLALKVLLKNFLKKVHNEKTP